MPVTMRILDRYVITELGPPFAIGVGVKPSFPLVHVIMALVAIPFALASPRSGGRAVGIGVAIVIAVGY